MTAAAADLGLSTVIDYRLSLPKLRTENDLQFMGYRRFRRPLPLVARRRWRGDLQFSIFGDLGGDSSGLKNTSFWTISGSVVTMATLVMALRIERDSRF